MPPSRLHQRHRVPGAAPRFGAPLVDLALRSWALGGDPAQRDRLEQQMVGEVAADEITVGESAPAAATAAAAAAAAAATALGGWGHGATGARGRVPDATMVWTDWLARFDQK
eukprot:scaffold64073_cov57-Phaeocystis_antarctica.AAC.6